jgi:hypothetical protein
LKTGARAIKKRLDDKARARRLAKQKQKQDEAITRVIRASERMGLYEAEDANIPLRRLKPTSSLG